ncbi:MAG: LTA synthase family protein [Alphaproteobacteria bacterium]|nr:LTA synthase family protein [Alphaproteobacteria bacterium]
MKQFIKDLLSVGFFFVALLAMFSLIWTWHIWGDVHIEQIFINLEDGVSEVSTDILKGYYIAFGAALIMAVLMPAFIKKNRYLFVIGALCLAFVFYQTGIVLYLLNKHIYTDLYEKEYVAPENITYTFPLKKRNLIVVYLESMEADYADPQLAGKNLIKNLSAHMQNDLSFEGFYQIKHQDYTIAAMVESMCAIAYRNNIFHSALGYQNFLSGAVCYPQILSQNGYRTYFMKGASIKFARTGLFMSQHGFDSAQGKVELEKKYHIPIDENMGAFSGYRDSVLFEMAKLKLNEISQKDEPFFLAMITLDTHTPDIYLDQKCTGKNDDIKAVISCTDQLVEQFLDWIKVQPFYDNTTVVVLSDHPYTGKNRMYPNHKDRKIVNFILNPATKKMPKHHKAFTTLDIAPTVLNAIGVEFKDGKFGLGRSLFEDTPTLYEVMGHALETEFSKASHVYEGFEELKAAITPTYKPYPAFGVLVDDLETIESYTTYSNTIIDAVYLNDISFRLPFEQAADVTMKVRFKAMLNNKHERHIKVFANGFLLDEWDLSAKDKQPIVKQIRIKKEYFKDNRLAMEFLADDPFIETMSIGLMDFEFE